MAPPFFRRSKSVLTTAAELATVENGGILDPSAPPAIRKSKSFKRIRGLLRVGSSMGAGNNSNNSHNKATNGSDKRRGRLRGRKAGSTEEGLSTEDTTTTPTAANLSSITTTTGGGNNMADTSFISTASSGMMINDNNNNNMMMMNDDDVSAINYYNVDVDDRSVMTQRSTLTNNLFGATSGAVDNGTNPTYYILKVVLLLMDPETRRFELLQLEFDSNKALVSDVLAQIPISVTEDTLRQQRYIAIANHYGTEMIPTNLLASFCQGNEVLVAIPDNVGSAECIRLARPILSDENVVSMLRSSGIDASGWKEDPAKKKATKKKSALKSANDEVHSTRSGEIPLQAEPLDRHMKQSKGSLLFTLACMIFIGLLLQVFHIYISAPINVGSTISPGVWLSKCGLYSLVPSYCPDNAYVHFHRNGTVSYYNAEKVLLWTMEGAVCPDVEETASGTPAAACVRGMHVQNDGTIAVGGKPIHHVITYSNNNKKEPPLSPWPFVTNPKLKIWRK